MDFDYSIGLLLPELESTGLADFNLSPDTDLTKWKPYWLISKFADKTWELKRLDSKFNSESKVWEKTERIYWDVQLPNGKKLTDPEYQDHLLCIKKVVFFCREGFQYLRGAHIETTRATQQRAIASSLILVTRWMVLRELKPEIHGFRILTESDINEFCKSGRYGSQLVDGTYHKIEKLINRLTSNGKLSTITQRDGTLDYTAISKKIKYSKANETEKGIFPKLQYLINERFGYPHPSTIDFNVSSRVELPSHRSNNFKSACSQPVSESALGGYLAGLKMIGNLASTLKEEFESLQWLSEIETKNLTHKFGYKKKQKTPTIPIETAMEYLDHSIHWVTKIGPELIKAKKNCDDQLLNLLSQGKARKDHYAKQIEIKNLAELNHTLKNLGLSINRYNGNATNRNYAYVRRNLSIEEACECLIGAAFILINTFCCRRISEVLQLNQSDLRPAMDGGWELVFGLRKASPIEALSMAGRPIPHVVKDAVEILIDLVPKNMPIEPKLAEDVPLFLSMYRFNNSKEPVKRCCDRVIYRMLEMFADIVEIAPNKMGQRWYIRSHECRRIFAISYFWHNKFPNLNALSWFMGHQSPEETMHYVTELITGSELPEEEARYVANLMQDNSGTLSDEVLDLKKNALKNFNTNNINTINKADLEQYLELKFRDGIRVLKHSAQNSIIYLEEFYD